MRPGIGRLPGCRASSFGEGLSEAQRNRPAVPGETVQPRNCQTVCYDLGNGNVSCQTSCL
jgi:hypothetical protein